MPCGWDSVFGFLRGFYPFFDSTVYHSLYQHPSWKIMTRGKFLLACILPPIVVAKGLGGTECDGSVSSMSDGQSFQGLNLWILEFEWD